MDFNEIVLALVLGTFMFLVLGFIYFLDWTTLVSRLVKVFAPEKEFKDFDFNKKLQKDDDYKCHKRKWKIRFLIIPMAFDIAFLMLAFIFKNSLVAFFMALITTAIIYGVLEKKEVKERKNLITEIKQKSGIAENEWYKPDVEVVFEFNDTRKNPAFDGYRPCHLVNDTYLTSGTHHYYDTDMVYPNSTAKGTIMFLSPEAYPHCLWVGKKINIQEGERIVGYATITKIFNPILEK